MKNTYSNLAVVEIRGENKKAFGGEPLGNLFNLFIEAPPRKRRRSRIKRCVGKKMRNSKPLLDSLPFWHVTPTLNN